MKKEVEFFYNEYNEVCKKLCCDYKATLRTLKLKHANLLITKDSAIEGVFCEELKKIFEEYESSILQILQIIGDEFEKTLSKDFFEEFKMENEKNLNGYFEEIQVIIQDIIKREIKETTKLRLNILKENLQSSIINNMKKKNESIKRILKKERKKDSFLQKIFNSIIDNFIGYVVAFGMGFMTSHWNELIEFIKGIVSKSN